VVDLAIKEMVIEKALDKVDAEFSTMEIDLRAHGRTGTLVMAGGEALVVALDDTLLRLQALLMNPYVGPHKVRPAAPLLTYIALILYAISVGCYIAHSMNV
jgi:hypothetical protein